MTTDRYPDRAQIRLGYALASEEHSPMTLVKNAVAAERCGFDFAMISDHFHPWTRRQGQSPFVWSVLGAIAASTSRLQVGTGVTCPLVRIHPAIVAQASATIAAMMPGRFFLGVGTGENLNEHILGSKWPAADVRREMLDEAVAIIRELWTGEEVSYRGRYYTIENATIHSLPETPPPLLVAASGELAAQLAGEIGDGFISTAPDDSLVNAFLNSYRDAHTEAGGGGDKSSVPRYGQVTVCWAEDEEAARKAALEWWPTSALHGELSVELPLPAHFEQATMDVTEEQIAEAITCGPVPKRHLEASDAFAAGGLD
jgi:G6PDH family F420-dependent oxidoreductase